MEQKTIIKEELVLSRGRQEFVSRGQISSLFLNDTKKGQKSLV